MDLLNSADAQSVLRTARIGLWRVDMEQGFPQRFYADAVMDELLGLSEPTSPEERLSFFLRRIHPEDLPLFQDYTRGLTQSRAEIVYRYIHPISGEMVVRCGGSVVSRQGDSITIVGTHQDISNIVRLERGRVVERRLAEQNVTLRREQEQQQSYYRSLLDIQSCGLMAYTLPGHVIIHMNSEALRMYGIQDLHAAQSQLGTILSQIYYPDPLTVSKLKALRDSDDVVDYECVINRGQDKECHVMAKSKALRLPNGMRAVVTTFLDVSDMVMLKKALQQAQEGSRAKSSFLFAMSHDLRTPMNAIIGYADLIQRHWRDEDVCREYLRKLKDASRFLLGLIGNVLELSRIESGQEKLSEAPWDLRELGGTLDVLMEGEIARKDLTLHRQLELPQPLVFCDAMKLREILMNLLSNAVKYTPAGGEITLRVTQSPAESAGQCILQLQVQDNGIGIAESYLPHLFEAFTRERDSADSGIMGTGLGLRIVKSFVDLMNGSISVKSKPQEGSLFLVEVPLRLATPENFQTDLSPLPSTELAGRRILLAEDNALNAEITATILSDAKLLPEMAGDGAAALELLKSKPMGYYDLILMDVQMPRMNGYEATRAIRSLTDRRREIPIIAMTANAFEEDRQAAFAAGMDGYAAKPIDSVQLLRVIADTLQARTSD